MKKKRQYTKVLALYFGDDEQLRADYRDLMLERYLDETNDDLWEALGLLRWRLQLAEKQEQFEECAIIKDILEEFEHIPRD
jgi:hypothetical protein